MALSFGFPGRSRARTGRAGDSTAARKRRRRPRTGPILALAVLLVLALTAPAWAIVYGQPDDGRHPNVGAMLYDVEQDGVLDQICTGTLISTTVFLTASHCTAYVQELGAGPGSVAVTFDDTIGEDPTVYYGTAHTHPDFGFSGPGGISDPHDIAVVVLDEVVPSIMPAALPEESALDELKASGQLRTSRFTAVGYGAVRHTRKGGPAAILPNSERRFATQDSLALTKAWLTLSMNQATGDGGTCYGDSGGPHFLGAGSNETDIVVSITVTGDSVCKATDKTYRVDTASAREFLDDFVDLP
jgi:secreted trypsin-like serine protease